ncbi:hypothetical protein SY89_01628 [Halolamina pelagica]|uniref:Histidine kinase N-terminal 7TM region domain-containing protein n=1 Tax=Halolamina pelagica TaxID=699431 RepID=A0A0P7HVH7_9EURY|nr:histidine kinase N-terminal 7TM domain-containing protein [Halolamina pelagica]KPN30888.1 hypothetical protein SY89_01628 [Halolamina pelagica]
MDPLLLAHVALFGVSGVACLLSLPRAFRIKHPGTRQGLVALLLAVVLWSLGYVGYLVAPTDSLRLTSYTIGFIFAFVAVAAWTYFCAAYTGRRPRQAPYRWSMVGVFLLFVLLKLTNPLHNLYFTTAWTTDPFPHLAIQHGILYWVTLGLSYAVIAVGFFMLLERFYHTGTDSRPLITLATVTGVPAVVTIFGDQIDWLLPLMYEPPGVAVFAVGTLFVYVRRFEAVQLTGGATPPPSSSTAMSACGTSTRPRPRCSRRSRTRSANPSTPSIPSSLLDSTIRGCSRPARKTNGTTTSCLSPRSPPAASRLDSW